MIRALRWLCPLLAVCLPTAVRAEDTLEQVEQKILDAAKQIRALEFKQTELANVEFMGRKMRQSTESIVHYRREGEKIYFRAEQKSSESTTFEGEEQKSESKSLTVADGEFVYVLDETDGERNAIKNRPEPGLDPILDKDLFKNLHAEYNAKLLPSEKIDGRDVWVIEATPKAETPGPIASIVFYFRQDVGIAVRTIGRDKENREIVALNLSDIQVNGDVKLELFQFKLPEGVELIDRTLDTPASAPASRPSSAPASGPAGAAPGAPASAPTAPPAKP